MFRGTKKSEMSPKNFGAGSIVVEGREKYLVVADGPGLRLMDMSTFELLKGAASVEDANFISAAEMRQLIGPLQVASSDCDFDPKGLKP